MRPNGALWRWRDIKRINTVLISHLDVKAEPFWANLKKKNKNNVGNFNS